MNLHLINKNELILLQSLISQLLQEQCFTGTEAVETTGCYLVTQRGKPRRDSALCSVYKGHVST